jgi:hypothetical protein
MIVRYVPERPAYHFFRTLLPAGLMAVAGLLAVGASPAAAVEPAQLEITASTGTYLGYSPAGPVTDDVRVRNTGTVTARNVTIRLEMTHTRGTTVDLVAGPDQCVPDEKATTCEIGDVAAGSTVTLTIRWAMVTRNYNESGRALITATADDVAPTRQVIGARAGNSVESEGPDVFVRPRVPATVKLAAGTTVDVPLVLSAEGTAPADGVFVSLSNGRSHQQIDLIKPRGSTCIPFVSRFDGGLLCYLPEALEPGETSSTWGPGNPFRVRAKAGSAQPKPHDLSIYISPANGTFRNIGVNQGGTWKIQPTVPLTVTVIGNGHSVEDAFVELHVSRGLGTAGTDGVTAGGGATSGGAPAGGTAGGLPVTGPRTAVLLAGGVGALAAGIGGILFARRRRVVTTVD